MKRRTPHPFEPPWRAILGGVERHGIGLLSPELVPLKDLVDSFDVMCGGFKLTVKPKVGQILADGTPSLSVNSPCSLKWFRSMEIKIGTHDPNSAAPDCLWYGLGIEHGGKAVGYRVFKDGTATWGDLS